jgi:hypothetical protein
LRHHLLFGLFRVLGGCAGHGRENGPRHPKRRAEGREIKLTGSTEVRFSCNEMPVDRLLDFLKLAYPEGRIGKPAEEAETVSQTATEHARRGDQADQIQRCG